MAKYYQWKVTWLGETYANKIALANDKDIPDTLEMLKENFEASMGLIALNYCKENSSESLIGKLFYKAAKELLHLPEFREVLEEI